jgi:hypothetical protein
MEPGVEQGLLLLDPKTTVGLKEMLPDVPLKEQRERHF